VAPTPPAELRPVLDPAAHSPEIDTCAERDAWGKFAMLCKRFRDEWTLRWPAAAGEAGKYADTPSRRWRSQVELGCEGRPQGTRGAENLRCHEFLRHLEDERFL